MYEYAIRTYFTRYELTRFTIAKLYIFHKFPNSYEFVRMT